MFHACHKPFSATSCLSPYNFEIYAIVQAGVPVIFLLTPVLTVMM